MLIASARESRKLVELCKQNKNSESINTLYANDVESVEAHAPPGTSSRAVKGIEAVRGKNQWWTDNHVVHNAEVYGPYPHGDDRFAVRFVYDITHKPSSKRMTMDEVAARAASRAGYRGNVAVPPVGRRPPV